MSLEGAFLRGADVDDDLGAAWDALPAGRGSQGDIFDSWAWHAGALHADPGLARSMRIAAVLDGAQPRALLPLIRTATGSWRNVGVGTRARRRVVIGTEEPDPEVLDLLVETLARKGRALELLRMPSRDGATHELVSALRRAGYQVSVREESADRLAPVSGGWAGHSREYKSFAKYAQRFSGRVTQMWDLTMDTYGTSHEAPAAEGFRLYAQLQARSWKGPLDPRTQRRRESLVEGAERRGWTRVFVLRVAGEPVAAHVWFRVGDVATWMSTSHDQSVNALSPGTIVQWWSQERIINDAVGPPTVLDFLPGGSPQKDRLSPDRPPLLEVDAVRRRVLPGVSLRAQQVARRAVPSGRARWETLTERARERFAHRPEPAAATVRRQVVSPGRPAVPVQQLDPEDPLVRRFLTIAGGHSSAEAALKTWAPGDTWWRVGEGPSALARMSGAGERVVLEVVRLVGDLDLQALVGALATASGSEVTIMLPDPAGEDGEPVVIRDPVLPWPSVADTRA